MWLHNVSGYIPAGIICQKNIKNNTEKGLNYTGPGSKLFPHQPVGLRIISQHKNMLAKSFKAPFPVK